MLLHFFSDVSPSHCLSVPYELQDSEESVAGFELLLEQWLTSGTMPSTNHMCEIPDTSRTCNTKSVKQGEKRNIEQSLHARPCHGSQSLLDNVADCDTSNTALGDKSKGNECENIASVTDVLQGVCMVGLHCCGDLTPTMLRVFSHSARLRCLVCVSCCYHRMARSVGQLYEVDHSNSSYLILFGANYCLLLCIENFRCTLYATNNCVGKNSECMKCVQYCFTVKKADGSSYSHRQFPMSQTLKSQVKYFQSTHPDWNLSSFGLRLAAQETRY